MTATTNPTTATPATTVGPRSAAAIRRAAGWIVAAWDGLRERWTSFALEGQLGVDHDVSLGRHTGARI